MDNSDLCNFSLLGTYFYVIGISFDKTHFICIWVNLSRFKMIITSSYIEDMNITQELLKKSAICRSQYLLNRSLICWDSLKLDICLNLSSLWDSDYIANKVFILKGYLFMGLYNPYWTKKAQGLCIPIWNRRAHWDPI